MNKSGYVYILTNENNRVLYVGVTSDIKRRISQHKNAYYQGFSKKYNTNKLVYYESFSTIEEALISEKRIKNWKREWKKNLISKHNPQWKDLSIEILN